MSANFRSTKNNFSFVSLLAATLLLAATAFAQSASITGTVTDVKDAVVQSASVMAKNTATGATRVVSSSSTGSYSVTNLPVGPYEVTVSKLGFKVLQVSNIVLTVAQTLTVNARLDPGVVTEEVVVRGDELPGVELQDAQVSNLVDSRTLKALPLVTRNPYDLLLLSPGTSTTNASGGYTVNGSRERNNNFLLDGVDNNDTSVPGGPGNSSTVLSLSPESTEEFRVITNSFGAEFGRNTGAIVDVVTKSGTNEFHGNAYEFGRYNGFGGARDWFNTKIDQGGNRSKQNPYVRNQFGYSIGGPIWKNKTFFFFNQEFQRFRTTLTNTATVPTDGFKTGVFNTFDANGNPVSVDLRPGASSNQDAFNLPVDPTSQKLLSFFPKAQIANPDGYSGQIFFPSSSASDGYQAVLKIDQHITDRHVLNLRFGYDPSKDPNSGHADILPGNLGAAAFKGISYGLRANLVSTLTTTIVNNFNFGLNHIYAGFRCGGSSFFDKATPQVDQFGKGWDFTLNPFTSFGCTPLGDSNGQSRKTGTTSYGDDLTWVRGSHTTKFGGDFRNISEKGPNGFGSRRTASTLVSTFGFSLLQNIGTAGPDSFLDDAAGAFYGVVVNDTNSEFFNKSANRVPLDDKHFRQHEYSFFVQDSWKIRRNLTITPGLRYQLDGVPFEEGANFSNLLTSPSSFPVLISVVGPGTGKQIYKTDYSNIEPRLGFAWDPWSNGKTSVRAAFGIFHDRVFGNLFGNARGNPPFQQDYVNQPFDTLAGKGLLSSIGGGVFALPNAPLTVPSATILDGAHLSPVLFDTHFRNSSSNNWNFGIQRDISANTVIDLAYVGSKGTHIYRVLDGNPPDPTLTASLLAACDGVTIFLNNAGNPTTCVASQVTKGNLYTGFDNGFLPFNAVAHNALVQPFYNRSVGNSSYNALQLKVTRRFTNGFQIQGAYTWAHAIDDSGDPLVPAAGNRTFPRDSRVLSQERGNSDNDIRHIGVINYVWDLPMGKHKTHLNTGIVGKVLEGFNLSGIISAQTGHPFDLYSTRDSQRAGLSNRVDLVGNPFAAGPLKDSSAGKIYFTGCADASCATAFAQPPYGRAGNIGRNRFYGPHFVNFDVTLAKAMKIGERVGFEIRGEAFNLFNHPEFLNPAGTQRGAPNFGIITGTLTHSDGTTSARQLQVAAKITF